MKKESLLKDSSDTLMRVQRAVPGTLAHLHCPPEHLQQPPCATWKDGFRKTTWEPQLLASWGPSETYSGGQETSRQALSPAK